MDDRKLDEEEDEGSRRATNIGLLVAAVIVIGAGIWLVNALVDANGASSASIEQAMRAIRCVAHRLKWLLLVVNLGDY